MDARTNLVTMLGGAAVFGTVAGLTAGVATAAPSQTDGAMLYMCQDVGNPSSYRITVKGTYPMDSADAAGYLIHMNDGSQPGGLIVELKADDEGNNDHNIGYGFYPTTATTSEGYLQAIPGGSGLPTRNGRSRGRISTRTTSNPVPTTTPTRCTPSSPSRTATAAPDPLSRSRSPATSRSLESVTGAATSHIW